MGRTADSPQSIWQEKLLAYPLVPFAANATSKKLQYHNLTNPNFWWVNPLNPNSLRLTYEAWSVIKATTEIPRWKFELNEVFIPKTFLQLEKHFTGPYYLLASKKIVVLSDRDSMMLALHGGDLRQYLENLDQ